MAQSFSAVGGMFALLCDYVWTGLPSKRSVPNHT